MPFNTVKIFISSTFKDMDMERDLLTRRVEPRLNEHFAPMRTEVQFVDLRQSVETDRSLSQRERELKILRVCEREIQDCHPFFLGLVGHRYGWIPDIEDRDYEKGKLEALPPDFPIPSDKVSVTALEMVRGLWKEGKVNPQSLFFIRSRESLQWVEDEEQYLEKGEGAELSRRLRLYLEARARTEHYTLEQGVATTSAQRAWEDWAFLKIKDLLEKSVYATPIGRIQAAQERFVHTRATAFKGRDEILKEVLDLVEDRAVNIALVGEEDSGCTSILCKVTQILSKDKNNLCFFHSCKASPDRYTSEDVMRYYCALMQERIGEKDKLPESHHDLRGKYWDLIGKLSKQYRLIFINDGYTEVDRDSLDMKALGASRGGSTLIVRVPPRFPSNVPGTEYIKVPSTPTAADVIEFTRTQRRQVGEFMLKNAPQKPFLWLVEASRMAGTLGRWDYSRIRSGGSGDSEADIVEYLMSFLKSLPTSTNELMEVWIRRADRFFNHETFRDYLQLQVCFPGGWRDRDAAAMLQTPVSEIVNIRQMLGENIMRAMSEGRYHLKDALLPRLFAEVSQEDRQRTWKRVASFSQGKDKLSEEGLLASLLSGDVSSACRSIREGHLPEKVGLLWYALWQEKILDGALMSILAETLDESLIVGYMTIISMIGAPIFVMHHLQRALVGPLDASKIPPSLRYLRAELYVVKADAMAGCRLVDGAFTAAKQALELARERKSEHPEVFIKACACCLVLMNEQEAGNLIKDELYPVLEAYSPKHTREVPSFLSASLTVEHYLLSEGAYEPAFALVKRALSVQDFPEIAAEVVLDLLADYYTLLLEVSPQGDEMPFLREVTEPLMEKLRILCIWDTQQNKYEYYRAVSCYLTALGIMALYKNAEAEALLWEQVKQVQANFMLVRFGDYTATEKEELVRLFSRMTEEGAVWCELASALVLLYEWFPSVDFPFYEDDLNPSQALGMLATLFDRNGLVLRPSDEFQREIHLHDCYLRWLYAGLIALQNNPESLSQFIEESRYLLPQAEHWVLKAPDYYRTGYSECILGWIKQRMGDN